MRLMNKSGERFKMIRISWAVYEEIARRGVFGETTDMVLRRVFELPLDDFRKPSIYFRYKRMIERTVTFEVMLS